MIEKVFNIKLNCTYEGENNQIDSLVLENLENNEWEELSLDTRSPGFILYINGLFSCQHLYMRTNSAESGLILSSSTGIMKVVTNDIWVIQSVEVSFNATLKSGKPSTEKQKYILERMHHCPVSSNLPKNITIKNSVDFIN